MLRRHRIAPLADAAPADEEAIDVEHYVPAHFTWISNKLSRGASQTYLAAFDVGIEVWRVLVLLVGSGPASAQQACGVIGMDKASMSRCFQRMQARGLITLAPDPSDGRARIAAVTDAGRDLHARIRGVALERERAFLAVLSPDERATLIGLLRRLHANLPAVEAATEQHLARHHPIAGGKRRPGP